MSSTRYYRDGALRRRRAARRADMAVGLALCLGAVGLLAAAWLALWLRVAGAL
jgi:hypothetical protein